MSAEAIKNAGEGRRMSDHMMMKMSEDIGSLKSSIGNLEKSLAERDERITALLEKHDARIDTIETARARERGFVLGSIFASGTGGAGLMAAFTKIFGG